MSASHLPASIIYRHASFILIIDASVLQSMGVTSAINDHTSMQKQYRMEILSVLSETTRMCVHVYIVHPNIDYNLHQAKKILWAPRQTHKYSLLCLLSSYSASLRLTNLYLLSVLMAGPLLLRNLHLLHLRHQSDTNRHPPPTGTTKSIESEGIWRAQTKRIHAITRLIAVAYSKPFRLCSTTILPKK